MVGIILIHIEDFNIHRAVVVTAAPNPARLLPIVIGDIECNITPCRATFNLYSNNRGACVKSENGTGQIHQLARKVISCLACHINRLFPNHLIWSGTSSFSINNHVFPANSRHTRPSQTQIIMALAIVINAILAVTDIPCRLVSILGGKSCIPIGKFTIGDKFMLSKNRIRKDQDKH